MMTTIWVDDEPLEGEVLSITPYVVAPGGEPLLMHFRDDNQVVSAEPVIALAVVRLFLSTSEMESRILAVIATGEGLELFTGEMDPERGILGFFPCSQCQAAQAPVDPGPKIMH